MLTLRVVRGVVLLSRLSGGDLSLWLSELGAVPLPAKLSEMNGWWVGGMMGEACGVRGERQPWMQWGRKAMDASYPGFLGLRTADFLK